MFENIEFGPIAVCSDKASLKFHIDSGAKDGFYPVLYIHGPEHPDKKMMAYLKSMPEDFKQEYGTITGFLHMIKPVKIDTC